MGTRHWPEDANDAVERLEAEIERLHQRLHEVSLDWQASQAREAKLREALDRISTDDIICCTAWDTEDRCMNVADHALALPTDDTALREYRRKVLLEAAERLREVDSYMRLFGTTPEKLLRRMAEEE